MPVAQVGLILFWLARQGGSPHTHEDTTPHEEESEESIEAVENLLESYFMQIDSLYDRLVSMGEQNLNSRVYSSQLCLLCPLASTLPSYQTLKVGLVLHTSQCPGHDRRLWHITLLHMHGCMGAVREYKSSEHAEEAGRLWGYLKKAVHVQGNTSRTQRST